MPPSAAPPRPRTPREPREDLGDACSPARSAFDPGAAVEHRARVELARELERRARLGSWVERAMTRPRLA